MTMTTATRSSTQTATAAPQIELAWQVERLEAGDFAALSSDGKTWYAGNIFTAQCECASSRFNADRPCKHTWAARMAYWQVLDDARRMQATQQALHRRQPLTEHDLAGTSWDVYYAPLPEVA